MADQKVKFFVHANNNAPQISNRYGCILDILDACLINGIQVGSVLSVTASEKVATIVFSTVHNLLQKQWIKLSGAAQSEFNGEFRVKSILDGVTITVDLVANATVSAATGTINCALAPLDWEKPFGSVNASGGGKGAYRSKNTLVPNRPYLRVMDERHTNYGANYAKYAKVGIVETMTDIDTMSGIQAPYISSAATRNWTPTGSGSSIKNGWAKWYYATANEFYTDDTALTNYTLQNGKWLLVGTDTTFYLLPTGTLDTNGTEIEKSASFLYGFGVFDRFMEDDVFTHFLSATNLWETAAGAYYRGVSYTQGISSGSPDPASTVYKNLFLQRGYKLSVFSYATSDQVSLGGTPIASGADALDGVTVSSISSGALIIKTPMLLEIKNNLFLPRGTLPLIKTIPHKTAYSDFEQFTQQNKNYIVKNVVAETAGTRAQVLFDLGG